MFLKSLQISLEKPCVAGSPACKFFEKRLQHKYFPVKLLRTLFSTEHLRWLIFKIRNSNNLFKDVSAISLTHSQSLITYNSHNDKLIWKSNPFTYPNLVPIEHFCNRFRTNSLLPEIDLTLTTLVFFCTS